MFACCVSAYKCEADQEKCDDDSVCIPKTWKCDGHQDCNDNSDERDCGMWPFLFPRVCKPAVMRETVACSSVSLCMQSNCAERNCGMWLLLRLWYMALAVPKCVQTTCGERDHGMWPLLFLSVCKPPVMRETVVCGPCCS